MKTGKQFGLEPATSRYLTANGIRLHFWDWGGDGPPLVFLHGNGFLGAVWAPLAARFAERYRCLALDMRGYGDSGKPPPPYTFGDLADDVEGWASELGLGPVHVVAHSLGALVTTAWASRLPQRFGRIVLCDPVLVVPSPESPRRMAMMVNMTLKRRALWPSYDSVLEAYGDRPPFDRWQPGYLELYVRHGFAQRPDGPVELKCPPETEAFVHGWSAKENVWEWLAGVQAPLLVLRGAGSDAFSPEAGEKARGLIRNGRLRELSGCSHFLQMEQPDRVHALARDWLTGAEREF